jgi:hypothetical protein
MTRAWIGLLAGALSRLFIISAAVVLVAGGYSIRYGVFRLSSHSVARDGQVMVK